MMNSYFILCLVTFTIQIKAMFYINTRKNPGPIKQKQLLDAMLVPPEERLTKDHRVIYRFFIGNEMLKQIERTKSLNARIKCVAALLLISRQDFVPEQHIIMYVFEDQRAIILPKQAKASAQAFNQKLIRRKMDLIGTFSIMQSLKYDQLLYLAFNMEQISCKYKDYLYREGQVPQFFYLIVEGQFHYVKDCNQHQAKIKLNKKDKNKSKQLKSIEQEDQNPNKYVKSHINRYKIGIVEGKLGQAVGLEEIMLEEYKQARKYSVICNSTENKCVKIHKKYVQTLFQELPYFQQLIYNQIRGANNAKIQLLKRIKITKFHLKQNMNKSIQKSNKHQERYQQVEMRSLQNRAQSLSKLKLPTLHMKSSINYDYNSKDRSRAYSSALAGSLKSQQNHVKSLKSQQYIDLEQAEEQKQQEQDEGSFALTSLKVQSNKKPVKSPSKEDLLSQSYRTAQVRESFQVKNFDPHFNLPLIGKKSVTDIQGSSISLKHIIKIKQKSKMNQYGGMVDCSKLIEEKQDIFERKNNKITREQIFPIGHIEYRQPRKISMEDPMKLKASPAHSNRFMQKMLLKVLKRAGYDEAGKDIIQPKQQNLGNITVNVKPVTNQFHKSLSKHKRRQSNQHKNVHKQQLLVNSAFDECYFAKI